ncbi:hypothetical protein M9H77_03179 [Catharanthus roseus]|uniref:Uncharacterized protein n=1 Tax=Catharanthus roseus TaxID=4058 RepID=A0ACC0CAI9_CATRO|nr:hypothetical protein M9H77_03179 [Catharanthus roseus]
MMMSCLAKKDEIGLQEKMNKVGFLTLNGETLLNVLPPTVGPIPTVHDRILEEDRFDYVYGDSIANLHQEGTTKIPHSNLDPMKIIMQEFQLMRKDMIDMSGNNNQSFYGENESATNQDLELNEASMGLNVELKTMKDKDKVKQRLNLWNLQW